MRTGPGNEEGPLGGRETMRMLLPSFIFSSLLVVVGIILVLAHHRGIGLFLIVVAAAAGFVVRMRLMLRSRR
jgi:Flp pilus assembly protein TadB